MLVVRAVFVVDDDVLIVHVFVVVVVDDVVLPVVLDAIVCSYPVTLLLFSHTIRVAYSGKIMQTA